MKQVLEKLSINKAKLLLKLNVDLDSLSASPGHKCDRCNFDLTSEQRDVMNSLERHEKNIEDETMMSLVYIAGYASRKSVINENELFETTTFYYQKHGSFQDDIDREGLQVPTDVVCQWVVFLFHYFGSVKNFVCRKSSADLFLTVADRYGLRNLSKKQAETLANIYLNNHCKLSTPRSRKEKTQKVLKLSEL